MILVLLITIEHDESIITLSITALKALPAIKPTDVALSDVISILESIILG